MFNAVIIASCMQLREHVSFEFLGKHSAASGALASQLTALLHVSVLQWLRQWVWIP